MTSPRSSGSSRGSRWSFALAVGAVFGVAASRFAVNDSDLFWHLASGRWMVEHGSVLRGDVFSSTLGGAAVPVHQWLGELALWMAFASGSWWTVLALRVLAVTAIATLVMGATLARASRPAVAALAAFPALALSRFVWGDRPELLGLLAFAAFVPLAAAARGADRWAQLALVPLFALWANLHGGFVVGVALLIALATEALVFARAGAPRFAAFGALAIAATLVNPLGPGAYLSPGWHFANPPRFIEEWGVPDVTTFPGLLYASTLLGALGLALLAPSGRATDAALLAPLAFLSLSALRQMPLFALAAAPFLSDRLSTLLPRPSPAHAPRALPLAGVAFAAVLLAVALVTAPREPDLSGYPLGALPVLRTEPGTLFNEYDWGGFLIWYAPEHPVFVDGRLVPYIDAGVLDEYREAIGVHPRWRAVLDHRGISLVLVRPSSALAVRLREAGWSTLHADETSILLRRP